MGKNTTIREENKTTIKLNPFQEKPIIGLRIVDAEFAESLSKGVIHFSNPSIWRDSTKCSGLQLDLDDGCFCSSLSNNDDVFKRRGRAFIKVVRNGLYKYYEKVDNLAGCCFFAIKPSDFKDGKQQYGIRVIDSKEFVIKKDYFDNFVGCDHSSKKVVVFFDMYDVLDRIIECLVKMGCKREEIFYGNIFYINKVLPFVSVNGFPFEFLLKDEKFKNQSEFRIIVHSKNKEFWKTFKNAKYNLNIGDITSKTMVQDYYQEDMFFSIQGNKLLFSLSKPITTTGKDIAFSSLVGTIYQLLQNMWPGPPLSRQEIDEKVNILSNLLMDRFGVKLCDDWRLENVPYDLFLTLPDIYRGMCRSMIE